jgi:PAS domain S-box-containing protein
MSSPPPTDGAGALLAAIVAASDDAIVSKTLDGVVTSWNPGAERLFGWRAHEIIGQSIFRLIPAELVDEENAILERLRAGERIDHYRTVRVRKDGARVDVSLSVSPLRDARGTVVGAAKIARDISGERRAAERAELLYRITARLGGLLGPDEIADLLVRESCAAVRATDGRVALLRDDALEVVARRWGAERGTERERVPLDGGSVLAGAALAQKVVAERIAGTDGYGPSSRLGVPLATEGRLFGVLELVLPGADVGAAEAELIATLARQAAQALERAMLFEAETTARAEAELANRAKTDFLAAMSHELRTPLNAIAGFADLLDAEVHGPLEAGQRDSVRRIQRNQRHLLALINDLLSFARLEAGHIELTVERIRVSDVLSDLETLVGPQMRAKGLSYSCRIPPDDPSFMGDRERVRQILLNLLSNAIKFTDPGGKIMVDAVRQRDRVALRVRDTGIGISAADVQRIFDPFVQPQRTLSSGHAGAGLGLAISRELAQMMRGDIEVQSELGKGSTFTLSLREAAD